MRGQRKKQNKRLLGVVPGPSYFFWGCWDGEDRGAGLDTRKPSANEWNYAAICQWYTNGLLGSSLRRFSELNGSHVLEG